MATLHLINSCIKYLYIVLLIVIVVLIVKLLKATNKLVNSLNIINTKMNSIKKSIKDIDEKINAINYTLTHSIPFFAFIFFVLAVLIATIKDYCNTKKTKRNFVKSAIKQYGIMDLKYSPKKTAMYRKAFISQIRKLA